ncbi:MAG TPA: phosphoenolpyruvate--protein phosphotransferase [Vicinamibacteria bacterium]|nr:phosphoenolpyruvate--protein phosphotransferase [Vicinamibacteria bacterium]
MELKGIGVSPGIAVGEALIVEREAVPVFRLPLPPEAVEPEVQRVKGALEQSRRQIQAIKGRLAASGGPHAYIFDAHLLMLEDPLLVDRLVSLIRQERVNGEWAVRSVAEQLQGMFDEFTDPYLRETRGDLDDLLGRVQINLGGSPGAPSLSRLPGQYILVASGLTPSDLAELDWARVLGVATDSGSATHHTSILARSFGVPAVVGLGDATRRIAPGTQVVVDGTRGRLLVRPTGPLLEGMRAAQDRERREDARLQDMRALPAQTRDGVVVRLRANAEFPDEAATARRHGAEGIGLFRSEYLLGRSRQWPTEERQYEVYRQLLEHMSPHSVTVRAFDLGPEDLPTGGPSSPNPALGERGLRLLRHAPDAFRAQLRALLRASAHGPLRLMLPFISGGTDLREALDLLEEVRGVLASEGQVMAGKLPIGVNLEVPSAALTADLLLPDVDFFSIGTNDLVQYLLAADRVDPRVSAHYQPLHPAVLRVIRHVVESADAGQVPVSVCGEMAAEPLHALVLVGLGVRELSLTPVAIPRVKQAVRSVSERRVRAAALAALTASTAEEVQGLFAGAFAGALAPPEDGRPEGVVQAEE